MLVRFVAPWMVGKCIVEVYGVWTVGLKGVICERLQIVCHVSAKGEWGAGK